MQGSTTVSRCLRRAADFVLAQIGRTNRERSSSLRSVTRFYALTVSTRDFPYSFRPHEGGTTKSSKAIDEAQIRALIEDRVKAVRVKYVNGVISNHAPDILSFDVVNPLQYDQIRLENALRSGSLCIKAQSATRFAI